MVNGVLTEASLGAPTVLNRYAAVEIRSEYWDLRMPAMRVAANGKQYGLLTGLRAYAKGKGGSRTMTIRVLQEGKTTLKSNAFAVSSGTVAEATGWKTIETAKPLLYGGEEYVFSLSSSNGSFYFGSGGDGTIEDEKEVHYTDMLAAGFQYGQVPTAPSMGTVITGGSGQATLSWSGPSDDGGLPLTGYRVAYATNALFTENAGYKDIGLTTTVGMTGLLPNQQYYFRVAARNAVSDAAATSGPWSATVQGNVHSGGKIAIDEDWKDLTIRVAIGGQWRNVIPRVDSTGAWHIVD